MEKFTPLAKISHCRRQWRQGQISPLVLTNRFSMLECSYDAIHIDHKKVLTNRFPASSTVSWYFTHLQKKNHTEPQQHNNQHTAQLPSIPSLRLCTRSTQAAQWRRGEPPPSHLGPAGGGDVFQDLLCVVALVYMRARRLSWPWPCFGHLALMNKH